MSAPTPASPRSPPPIQRRPLQPGTYAPPQATDLRSPCPMVNCLANHGHIARDGRGIRAAELYAAVRAHAGISSALAAGLSYPVYQEKQRSRETSPSSSSWWTRLTAAARAPLARVGMRPAGQVDSEGKAYLDLDQLALPGAIEHDVSLTRRDHQQPQGNTAMQLDLVDELLSSSADGKTITREDLAEFRRKRIATQRHENPGLVYDRFAHLLSCGEISFILGVVGNGSSAPVEYVRAFLLEERLPIREGWKKRSWWSLGIIELQIAIFKVWRMINIDLK